MKIKEYIATNSACLAERNRLTAWLAAAQAPIIRGAARTSEDPGDSTDVDDFYDDYFAAMYPPRPQMILNEAAGYTIIPVVGMITQGLSVFEQRYFGCCDVDDIAEMVEAAATNPLISKVFFVFDSPGGYIAGIPELSDQIAALSAQKQTIAFSKGMMCSAAYWLAAHCGRIIVSPTCTIGSIGVYCTFLDLSKMAEQEGIQVRVFASGKFKGMGEPGTSLTKEQSDHMQGRIDHLGAQFRSAVTGMRPNVPAAAMEGQWFYGSDVRGILCDGLADNLHEIILAS